MGNVTKYGNSDDGKLSNPHVERLFKILTNLNYIKFMLSEGLFLFCRCLLERKNAQEVITDES